MSFLYAKDSILNFAYLTASFYNYIGKSNIIFKAINISDTANIDKNFSTLNKNNYNKFFDDLCFINITDNEESKSKKIELIESVLNKKFIETKTIEIEKIFLELSSLMNYEILSNISPKAMQLLGEHSLKFIIHIYQLFNKIIQNMKKEHTEKIQKIVADNLLEEDIIKSKNKNLTNTIKEKNLTINSQKKIINEHNHIEEKLNKIIEEKTANIRKIHNEMIELKNQFNNFKNEYKEKEIHFKNELKEKEILFKNELKEKEILFKNELKDRDNKINEQGMKMLKLTNEINQLNETVKYLKIDLKKKEKESSESKKKIKSLENEIWNLSQQIILKNTEIKNLENEYNYLYDILEKCFGVNFY